MAMRFVYRTTGRKSQMQDIVAFVTIIGVSIGPDTLEFFFVQMCVSDALFGRRK